MILLQAAFLVLALHQILDLEVVLAVIPLDQTGMLIKRELKQCSAFLVHAVACTC